MNDIVLAYSSLVGPLSESRLEQFENRLGRRLPAEYPYFLLALNGGVPRDSGLRFFNGADEQSDETLFECYYSLNDANVPDKYKWRFHESLDKIWELLLDNLTSTTLVPIGCDVAGNLVCIETDEVGQGQIFLWDHDYNQTYPLALSLFEFHASLTETEDTIETPSVWESRTE